MSLGGSNRSKVPWDPICHWDRTTPVIDSPYRTPDSEMGIFLTRKVCGPGCPERPTGVPCHRYDPVVMR